MNGMKWNDLLAYLIAKGSWIKRRPCIASLLGETHNTTPDVLVKGT
jgi:hypothetical protein